MKLKNTIALIAFIFVGATTTQAKSNFITTSNKVSQVQKYDPPTKNPSMSDDQSNDGGTVWDPNPPIYTPPYPTGNGK